MRCRPAAAGAALCALLLAACSNNGNPLDLEPGVYKGAPDPLTSKSVEERASVLSERFKLVQERQ